MSYLSEIKDEYLLTYILDRCNSYYLVKDVIKHRQGLKEYNYINEIDKSYDKFPLIIKYSYIDLIEEYVNKVKSYKDRRYIYNMILIESIKSNRLDIIDRLIELGANNYERGLIESIRINNIKLVDRFIKLGASDWDNALWEAISINNISLSIKFLKLKYK